MMKDGNAGVREQTENSVARRSVWRLRWEWLSRAGDSLSWPTASGVCPRSPGKGAANTQTSSLGTWLQLYCAWSAIPPGNPTEIFGRGFGTTGEETSSSPPPVWRALYKFMLCWLNTSAVETPAVRLLGYRWQRSRFAEGLPVKDSPVSWGTRRLFLARACADLILSLCSRELR